MTTTTPARGFTIIECALSIIILSGLLMAGMRALEVGNRLRISALEDARATQLGESMLAEVLSNYVGEPSVSLVGGLVSGALGIDLGENSSQKQTFDDIDDYDDWSESPPQHPDGTTVTGHAGWRRAVTVINVTVANPATISGPRTGLVRVIVTVTTPRGRDFVFSALRADAMQAYHKVPRGKDIADLTYVEQSAVP